ncbi:MvaI/BcnI family restriction endonuclease [Flavihumibacter sp.]|uniref:MvaI/BcnI family restriction endonuclease n=1 Tax=Flavihumibacter sp. TaxID=1913981 RepID=UPI002FCA7940
MRELTSSEIDKIKILTENSVELTLIEPTATGLEKSIMDATGPVRNYLRNKHLHDYELQGQGPEEKVLIDSFFVKEDQLLPSVASLYRPQTKKGDPRIWFKGLGAYAKSGDIIGIIAFEKKLYLVNVTNLDIKGLINDVPSSIICKPGELPFSPKKHLTNSHLLEIVQEIKRSSNKVAEELLALLKKIAASGPMPAMLNADTAIGRTLETLLGISINSSKQPDYQGIELKSFRESRDNRKNLFAQVPDWSISKFKSSAEILRHFGYERGNDYKLYCTVSTLSRNSQGLKLKVDTFANKLFENSQDSSIGDFVVWQLETLHKRLLEKHSETFWIAAESTRIDGQEYFTYKKVEHTKKPIVSQFDILLEQGIITLDHLIKMTPNGKVVEKGPLFKIKPNAIGLLFPPSKIYDLR